MNDHSTWRNAIALARGGDPSLLAFHLTRGNLPAALRDEVYGLLIEAPWRNAKPGARKKLSHIAELALLTEYQLLTTGVASAEKGRRPRPLSASAIRDRLCLQYGIGKRTFDALVKRWGLQKPPGVAAP